MSERETFYYDIAVLAGNATDDPWEAMADSYEFLGRQLVAVLQKTGEVEVPADWVGLTLGFVVAADPLPNGGYRLRAVRRGEVKSDSVDGAQRLSAKWHRLYVRRDERGDG